jgi:hypothetical protein
MKLTSTPYTPSTDLINTEAFIRNILVNTRVCWRTYNSRLAPDRINTPSTQLSLPTYIVSSLCPLWINSSISNTLPVTHIFWIGLCTHLLCIGSVGCRNILVRTRVPDRRCTRPSVSFNPSPRMQQTRSPYISHVPVGCTLLISTTTSLLSSSSLANKKLSISGVSTYNQHLVHGLSHPVSK